ncbi:colanic acid/amylovoran biosynthesis protein [Neobacillus bataviensis]|uniref:Colanic acid/amylovoran biosynthesis protein n=1 Tax=Neobacillus bataviensis TaxID=220685 RepID=A0A561CMB5_9BACI|nr:polysaccharide pyruvyl transferase family protein [Neobacillus bataviensis]TWD92381.1 colanic acid/amylovoran biosynthesis protein [Neobacillus bataviensis]
MKKILIINAHSSKNKGDAAIIISMIQTIRKFVPNSEITISSRYPEDDSLYEEFGCKVVEQITRFPSKNLSFIQRLTYLMNELKTANKFVKGLNIPSVRSNDIFKCYQESDIIVSCGGGFLYSHPKYHIEASLIMHLAQIYFATKLNKKVILYSQSIGPFRSTLSKRVANFVFKKVSRITIREELSRKFLEDIGINNPIVVGDSAFTMNSSGYDVDVSNLVDINYSKFNVGVTVRQWEFPGKENPKELYKRYIQSVADTINHLVKNKIATVYLVPQVTGPTPIEDDRISNKHVLDLLDNDVRNSVIVMSQDYRPEELKAIYSKFNMFIGTRMHSNIFSLSSMVPTVAIAYEAKTTGIMKLLDLSKYVLDINKINSDDLVATVENCMNNTEIYRKHLNKHIPLMIEKAEEPAKLIKKMVN